MLSGKLWMLFATSSTADNTEPRIVPTLAPEINNGGGGGGGRGRLPGGLQHFPMERR